MLCSIHVLTLSARSPIRPKSRTFDHIKAGVCLFADGCIYREDTTERRVPHRSSSAHRALHSYTFGLRAGALANV